MIIQSINVWQIWVLDYVYQMAAKTWCMLRCVCVNDDDDEDDDDEDDDDDVDVLAKRVGESSQDYWYYSRLM
jgi:hypothetical protein